MNVYNGLGSGHGGYPCVNNAIVLLNSQINKYRNNIQVKSASYSNSNVEFIIPGAASWNKLGDSEMNPSIVATTVPKSTSGTFYIGYKSLPYSGTVYINYAMIWYNPTYDSMMGGAYGNRTAMHEMLHVFGMGHYRNGDSLTNDQNGSSSTTLTAYDAEQFRTMYP